MPKKPRDPAKPPKTLPVLEVIQGGVPAENALPVKGKAGRPTLYSEEAVEKILDGLYAGLCMIEAIDQAGYKRQTVYDWMEAHPDFRARCVRARDALTEIRLRDLRQKIHDAAEGGMDPAVLRVLASHEQWAAERIAPRLYGNKSTTEITNVNTIEQKITIRFEEKFRNADDGELDALYELLTDATDEG